jgi:uncharacterized secreted protein with C-terminal beta-propeller domain
MENNENSPMLLHSTYFNLGTSNTPNIIEAYMAEARQYLSESKDMISFWIGTKAADMVRPENDIKYDIAMHQLFKNEAAFNLYNANDTSHNQFVADVNRWVPGTTRRVMDAYVTNLIIGGNTSEAQFIGTEGNYPKSMFHNLYFSLTDKSEKNIKNFTDICVEYLSGHPGIQQFTTGGLTDIKRDVSVRNFEVAVSIIYESKKAYDDYLKSKRHDDFFPATAGMIENTYIFDSYLKYQSKVYSLTRYE